MTGTLRYLGELALGECLPEAVIFAITFGYLGGSIATVVVRKTATYLVQLLLKTNSRMRSWASWGH